MEFKRIWLSYGENLKYDEPCLKYWPVDDDNTRKADQLISEHLANGWRIVSTSPVLGSTSFDGNSDGVFPRTMGIEVFMVKD